MDSHYDILTTVTDMNCSISENIDLPCKNIYLAMTAIFLSKTHRVVKGINYSRNSTVVYPFHSHVTS